MRGTLRAVAVIGLLSISAVQAAILDISLTAQGAGYNGMVADAKLRGDGGLQGDNLGAAAGDSDRFFSLYNFDGTLSGRLNNFVQRFDVSSIPAGSYINSAFWTTTFGVSLSAHAHSMNGLNLSQLQPGKGWTEGVSQPAATDGSVTWNSQVANTIPWATPGATGAADIYQGTTIPFNVVANADGTTPTVVTLDIASFVQDWVNTPSDNTGLVMWGGRWADSGGNGRYFEVGVKENGSGTTAFPGGPTLVIDYTVPEPGSAVLLVAGLLPLVARARKRS